MTKVQSDDMAADETTSLECDKCPSIQPDLIPKDHHVSERIDSGYSGSIQSVEYKPEMMSSLMEVDDVCSSFGQMELSESSDLSSAVTEQAKIETETGSLDTNAVHGINDEIERLYDSDADGDTHLHMAIINLLNPIAICIIQSAPRPDWLNIPNNLLQTPLHLAVILRAVDVTYCLLLHGADRTLRDLKGDTPLHIACRKGYDELVDLLLNFGYKDESVDNGENYFQDLNSRNYNGQTCLHISAEHSNLKIMSMLILKGADVNSREGKSGRTVLHFAAETGNKALLEYLIQTTSLDFDSTTYAGLTAIELAYGRNFKEIFNRLLSCS